MKCVWEQLSWGRKLEKNYPTKGIVAWLHQNNAWVEMPHDGRSRTGTKAPELCHACSLTVCHLLSSGMASLQLTALPAVCSIGGLGSGR